MNTSTGTTIVSERAPHPPMQGRHQSTVAGPYTRDPAVVLPCRILSIGDDADLLRTRELIFRSAGYKVVSAPSSFVSSLDVNIFHVFVLCHELRTDKVSLLAYLRAHAEQARVILLSDFAGGASLQDEVEIRPFPALLLATVQQSYSEKLRDSLELRGR